MQPRWVGILMGISCCVLALYISGPDATRAEGQGVASEKKIGDVVMEVTTDQKVMALTFDDGPDPVYTPRILDLLKKYHAKATFFVLGKKIEQYPEIAKRAVLEGNELANHTYRHPSMRRISPQSLIAEIEKAHDVIQTVTGQQRNIFRPPGGVYNQTVVRAAKQAGYIIVIWSLDTDAKDWSNPGVNKIVNRVIRNAHNGGIVLFHDSGGDRSQTVAALEQIVPRLTGEGYQFLTVTELLHLR